MIAQNAAEIVDLKTVYQTALTNEKVIKDQNMKIKGGSEY
jgi:hypothetical protein